MSHENRVWQGVLDEIISRNVVKPEENPGLIEPTEQFSVTRIQIKKPSGSAYCGLVYANVSDNYLGHQVSLTVSIKSIDGIKILTEQLVSPGLESIETKIVYKR